MLNKVINSIVLPFIILMNGLENVQSQTEKRPAHDKVVVCYISTWAVYRPRSGAYTLEDFQPNLCTHAIYAFAGLDPESNEIKSLDPWQDLADNYGKAGYDRMVGFKRTYPHLKVLLAIGGWNEGSANYSRMAASTERRSHFVKQTTEFVTKHKFDGLDLDWEYPTQRGGAPEDKENFVSLCKELKEAFKPHNLLLTAALGAGKTTIDAAYNIKELEKHLDFFNMMCYDYGGSWDKVVSANAPLRSRDSNDVLNVEYSINYVIQLGAPPSKIVMGLPFYGRTFVAQTKQGRLGDPSDDVGFQGQYTRENGFMGYNEICETISKPDASWNSSWDGHKAQAIASYRDVNTSKVVVFDSPRSIANKMRFAMKLNLAGAMIWSVDTDDFRGDCEFPTDTYEDFRDNPNIKLNIPNRKYKNYALLNTVNDAIVLSLEELKGQETYDNEVTSARPSDAGSNRVDKLFLFTAIVAFILNAFL